MKKTFLLITIFTLLLVLFNTIALASDSRWALVYSTKEAKTYLDTYTHSTYSADNKVYVDCWIKIEFNDSFVHAHYLYRFDDLLYMEKEFVTYEEEGKRRSSSDSSEKGWQTAIPDSNLERTLRSITIWMSDHLATNPPKVKQ